MTSQRLPAAARSVLARPATHLPRIGIVPLRAGFLTPKAIGNRIKSKGLQKLRWFCQVRAAALPALEPEVPAAAAAMGGNSAGLCACLFLNS